MIDCDRCGEIIRGDGSCGCDVPAGDDFVFDA
jgi:hypothetical protein